MGRVEDIYRKVRRGDTAGLKPVPPSEHELVAGVERIRGRLSGSVPPRIVPPRHPSRWVWIVPVSVAAIALVTFLFLPEAKPAPVFHGFVPGSVNTFGSIEVRVLTTALLEHEYTAHKLKLRLWQGAIAIKRTNPGTALTIDTPAGSLSARGTAFLIEHEQTTSIELSEGSVSWREQGQERIIDPSRPRMGRDLQKLHGLLPAGYMNYPVSATKSTVPLARSAFAKYDCVIYTADGVRRQGIVREIVRGQYRVARDGTDEETLFPEQELLSCNRTRPLFGAPAKK